MKLRIENPICSDNADPKLTFYGSFLPVNEFNSESHHTTSDVMMIDEIKIKKDQGEDIYPGKVLPFGSTSMANVIEQEVVADENNIDEDGEIVEVQSNSHTNNSKNSSANAQYIEINKNRGEPVYLTVTNLSNQRIRVGSHFNFIEANKQLQFDRALAFGKRLVRELVD